MFTVSRALVSAFIGVAAASPIMATAATTSTATATAGGTTATTTATTSTAPVVPVPVVPAAPPAKRVIVVVPAATETTPEAPPAPPAPPKSQYRFGLAYERFGYSEPAMTENGWLPGLYLGGKWNLDPTHALRIRVDYFNGNLSYNGSTFSGAPISNVKTKDWILNIEIGGDIQLNKRVALNIGLAQQYWNDNISNSFVRKTTYSYLPVGLTYNFTPNLWLKAVQNYWLVGYNETDMSMVPNNPPYGTIKMKQPSGSGWGVEMGWTANNNAKVNIEGTVFYREWHVNQSQNAENGGQTFYEPSNKTDIFGFNLGIVF